jgi:hypothetical protein
MARDDGCNAHVWHVAWIRPMCQEHVGSDDTHWTHAVYQLFSRHSDSDILLAPTVR